MRKVRFFNGGNPAKAALACALLTFAVLLIYAANTGRLSSVFLNAWSRDSIAPVDSRFLILEIDRVTLETLKKRYKTADPETLKLRYTAEALRALVPMHPAAIGIDYVFGVKPSPEDVLLAPLVSGNPPIVFSVRGSWPVESLPVSGLPVRGQPIGDRHLFITLENEGLHDFHRGRNGQPAIPFLNRIYRGAPPPFAVLLARAADPDLKQDYTPRLQEGYLLPVRFWTKESVARNRKNDPEDLFRLRKLEEFLESPQRMLKYCKGKIVLLGEAGSDAMEESYRTPVGDGMPNVIVTANAIRMLLGGAYFRELPRKLLWLLVFVSGMAAGLCAFRFTRGVFLPFFATAFFLFATYALGRYLFVRHNYFLDLSGIYLSVLPNVAIISAYKLYAAEHERRKIRSALDLYVGREVLNEFMASRNLLAPQGSKKQVTILFLDIRNFTAFVEKKGAEAALSQLREFFGSVASQVTEFGGYINKFLGDGFMAIFGVSDNEGHASKAVRAAFAMLVALEKQNAEWEKNGMEKLEVGIGINSGEVIWGNIAAAGKMEFTVTGDTVNTASRIEALTKEHPGYPVLLSESTRVLLEERDLRFPITFVREAHLRGKSSGIKLFGIPRKAGGGSGSAQVEESQ